MKKIFIFTALVAVVLGSCKKVTEVTEQKDVTEVTQVVNAAQTMRFVIDPEEWKSEDDYTFSYTREITEITADIFDHGVVLTYLSPDRIAFQALPVVYDGFAFEVSHIPGQLDISYRAVDGSNSTQPDGRMDVKVIILSADMIQAHPNVDLHNFDQVKQVFLQNQAGF